MAFVHGSKAIIKLGTATQPSNPVDISQYVTSVSDSFSAETAEVTTLGKTAKAYIPGLKDGTLSIEGKYDPAVDAHLSGILGMEVSFEYGPAGSGSGNPKYTGKCICTSYELETAVDSEATFSAEFQISEGWTRGTY